MCSTGPDGKGQRVGGTYSEGVGVPPQPIDCVTISCSRGVPAVGGGGGVAKEVFGSYLGPGWTHIFFRGDGLVPNGNSGPVSVSAFGDGQIVGANLFGAPLAELGPFRKKREGAWGASSGWVLRTGQRLNFGTNSCVPPRSWQGKE